MTAHDEKYSSGQCKGCGMWSPSLLNGHCWWCDTGMPDRLDKDEEKED